MKHKYRTHEEFVKEVKELHPKLTVETSFKGMNKYVIVSDKYGKCKVYPNNLLKGNVPTIKTAVNKTDYFHNLLRDKNSYYNRGYFTMEEPVKNGYCKIKLKTKYGYCKLAPNQLLAGKRPSIRSAVNKNIFISNKFREVHGDKYDYSKVSYKGDKRKVEIICPYHGVFKQSPGHHLRGKGCKKCAHKAASYNCWKYSVWENKGKNSANFDSYKLYIIHCFNKKGESFYKIGKTFRTIKNRYKGKHVMPYNYKVIISRSSDNAELVSTWENDLKNKLKKFRYTPERYFPGQMNECYKGISEARLKEVLDLVIAL